MPTEWHKVEFLTPGVLQDESAPTKGYKPQGGAGYGYYVVTDGTVVAQLDEHGHALDMTRVHECKVVEVLTSDPFPVAGTAGVSPIV